MTTQTKDNPFLRAALRYAELGFRVFPVKPRGKEPLVKDWPNQATNDRKIIQEWWSKYPNANIAILTGYYEHGFFCVLDFDPRNGGDWFDGVDESTLPPTCVVVTGGGGRHYYYLTSEPIPTKKLKDGVDLKGAGGYVLAPPSIHPNGQSYDWLEDEDIGLMPMGWLPDWAFFEAVGSDESKGPWKMKPPIPVGYRHNYIVSLAGVLWNANIPTEAIEKIIKEVVGLFETTADFDVNGEISRLMASLSRWQKKPKLLAHVIKDLPDEVKAIVTQHVRTHSNQITDKTNQSNMVPQNNNSDTSTPNKGGAKNNTENKKRSFRETIEAIKELKWVLWNKRPCFLYEGYIFDKSAVLYAIHPKTGRVPKEVLDDAIDIALKERKPERFKGVVLEDKLVYATINGIVGLWGHHNDKIYCYPVDQQCVLFWDVKDAPTGVYIKDGSEGLEMIDEETLSNPEQNLRDLLIYMKLSGAKLSHDFRLAYSMLIPIMISIDNAGFLFIGKAGSGKSTFATAVSYLEYGREWVMPLGNTIRDYVATLAGQNTTSYFDEMDLVSKDLEALLKVKTTRGKAANRQLYKDNEVVTTELSGAVIISTTGIKNTQKSDFWDRFFSIKFEDKDSIRGTKVLRHIINNHHKARAGIITAFRKAYKVSVPYNELPDIRFENWIEWSYRFACVFDVEDLYLRFIKYAKLESFRNTDFGFLVDFFRKSEIKEGHAYKLSDIYVEVNGLTADTNSELRRLYALLGRGIVGRNNIADIASAAGYDVRIEKQVVDKQKNRKALVLIFNKIVQRPEEEIEKEIIQEVEDKLTIILNKIEKIEEGSGKKEGEKSLMASVESETNGEDAATGHKNTPKSRDDGNSADDGGEDGGNDDDGGGGGGGGGNDNGGGGSGGGGGGDDNGGGGAPWEEGYDEEDDEFEVEDDDPWDDVEYQAKQGQAAVNEDPPVSAIIYEGEKIGLDDVKRYVKLILTDFLEDPPNKKDHAIQKLTEYIDIVNKKLKEEDLHTAMQYIQSQINTIKMIALLNGKKISFAEPYIPPSPKEVPVKERSAPAPAPPAPPPPKPPAPTITNQHSLQPTPPKPPPTASTIQNQVPPPAPPVPPPEPPPKPASPRLNYQTDDDFLGFMYAQMKNIRQNGGGDQEVAAFLLGLREEMGEYLRQKGLNHAFFILEATLKSFFIDRRV